MAVDRIKRQIAIDRWRAEHKEKVRQDLRKYRMKLRRSVLDIYGKICACCGEGLMEFLAIDHINGNGSSHRRQLGIPAGFQFYRWLKQQGFPTGYRVLCFNCNFSYGAYGYCPHNKIKEKKTKQRRETCQ